MNPLLIVGLALGIGYIGGKLSNLVRLPQVVGYILIGVIIGPSVANLLHGEILLKSSVISDFALSLVAFNIGSELRLSMLKQLGRKILYITLGGSVGAFVLVCLGTFAVTKDVPISLILGALASATAPAGTVAVLHEYRARGPLTNSILAVVGLDDGLAIVLYAFASAFSRLIIKGNIQVGSALFEPLVEVIGSIVLGGGIGFILGFVQRQLKTRTHVLTLTLTAILVCSGLCKILHFSLILANMALGMVLVNTYLIPARNASEAVGRITPPIFVIFFVLAGAHLNIGLLPQMGLLGVVYLITRGLGKVFGTNLAALLTRAQPVIQRYLGIAILSQAGVAIGLALLAVNQFSRLGPYGATVAGLAISTITATTIVLEIIGPIGVKIAIGRAGEAEPASQ
jgi:Kef-type K+ transport system membrane component KefB